MAAGISIIFGCSSTSALAGFLQKIAKQVTAPIRVIVNGDLKAIPSVIVPPLAGVAVEKIGNAIGGSVGKALENASNNPTAILNLPNVQFLQAVVAIKTLRAQNIITSVDQCHQISSEIATGVLAVTKVAQQAEMTKSIGEAACDTAIAPGDNPSGSPSSSTPMQSGSLQLPQGAASPGNALGFGGNMYPIYPIAQCFVRPVPRYDRPGIMILNGGPFMIMSNLEALKWNWTPPYPQWVKVGQLYFDGTALFVMRNNVPDMPEYQVAYSANGDVYLLHTLDGSFVEPNAVGHCT